jgi:hypothetical protein
MSIASPVRALVALGALWLAACAPSTVQTSFEQAPALGRPNTILVYDFAVSADEVQLDRGVVGDVESQQAHTPRTTQELELGHKVARIISDELVSEINAMGLPAKRAWGAPSSWERALVVEGQLLSVDQGNMAERITIGLGAGRSDVESRVQLYAATQSGLERLETFTTTMKSGYMPGMAETMGAGAIGGHLAVSALASGALHGAGEKFSADVEAEAKRTAKAIGTQLRGYFETQGWVPPAG